MALLFGKELIDKCPCGERVDPGDRQDIVFDPAENVWKRVCMKCINSGAVFDTNKSKLDSSKLEAVETE